MNKTYFGNISQKYSWDDINGEPLDDFKDKRLEFAKAYARDSVKEGCSEPEDWNLSDLELIKKAEYEGAKGDFYANEKI